MAEEIKIQLLLEGLNNAVTDVGKLGDSFSEAMKGFTVNAKLAEDRVNALTKAVEKAGEATKAVNSISGTASAGGAYARAPQPVQQPVTVSPQVTLSHDATLTIAGNFVKGFMDAFKQVLSPEDFNDISEAIKQKFSSPLKEVPKDAKNAEVSIGNIGKSGLKAFEQLGGATSNFAEALAKASSGAAVEGMQNIAGAAAAIGSSFGTAGAAMGTFAISATAVVAVLAGINAAQLMIVQSADDAIIATDNLGKAAGVTAAEMHQIEEAFISLGATTDQVAIMIRNISNKMLMDWPQVKREVRDAANVVDETIARFAQAQRNLESVLRTASLADEKVRDAQRGLSDADRGIEATSDGKTKAALAYEAALDGQVSATLRLADAERGLGTADREITYAKIALNEALARQADSAYSVANAYRDLKSAQEGVQNADIGLKSAELRLEQLKYEQDVKYGRRVRNTFIEKGFDKRQDKIDLESAQQAVDAAKIQKEQAAENKRQKEQQLSLSYSSGEKAAADVAAAQDRLAVAMEGRTRAELEIRDAQRNVIESNLGVRDANRSLADAMSKAAAALDDRTKAVVTLLEAQADQAAQDDKVAAARRELDRAGVAKEEAPLKDPREIMRALSATPEQRRQDKTLINLENVEEGNLRQAIAFLSSPDGVAKPKPVDVIDTFFNLINNNPGNTSVRNSVLKMLGPKGGGAEELVTAMEAGREAYDKAKAAVPPEELAQYSEAAVRAAYEGRNKRSVAASGLQTVMLGAAEQMRGNVSAQYDELNNFIKDDLPSFVTGIVGATEGLRDLTGVLKGIREFSDALGFTQPKPVMGPPAPGTTEAQKLTESGGIAKTLESTFWSSLGYILKGGPGQSYMDSYMGWKSGDWNKQALERANNDPMTKWIRDLFSSGEKQSSAGFLFGSANASDKPSGPLMEGNAQKVSDAADKTSEASDTMEQSSRLFLAGAGTFTDKIKDSTAPLAESSDYINTLFAAVQAFGSAVQQFAAANGGSSGGFGGGAVPGPQSFTPRPSPTVSAPLADNDPYKNIPPSLRANHRFPPQAFSAGSEGNSVPQSMRSNIVNVNVNGGSGGSGGYTPNPNVGSVTNLVDFEAQKNTPINDVRPIDPVTGQRPAPGINYHESSGSGRLDANKLEHRFKLGYAVNPWFPDFAKRHPELKDNDLRAAFRAYENWRTIMEGKDAYGNRWVDAMTGKRVKKWDGVEPFYKAMGGLIRGKGTSKSDSNPAMLSDGEYVMQADAVAHWGIGMLDAMNKMKAPGFAMGGLIGDIPQPNLSSVSKGGIMDNRYSLDIRTDAGTFPAMVSGDTMKAITKSAMGNKLKSSGVKPSWYGK